MFCPYGCVCVCALSGTKTQPSLRPLSHAQSSRVSMYLLRFYGQEMSRHEGFIHPSESLVRHNQLIYSCSSNTATFSSDVRAARVRVRVTYMQQRHACLSSDSTNRFTPAVVIWPQPVVPLRVPRTSLPFQHNAHQTSSVRSRMISCVRCD
jgi:hypothetical protein